VGAAYTVGAATRTGWVRANNEDDFLIGTLPLPAEGPMLCAIADGMGGAAGGAEASRLALRALAVTVLDGASEEAVEGRFRRGFEAASARVFEEASNVPALRDMGTTLTALCLRDGSVRIGHVGDTRAYRVRGGVCEQLTRDHAVREPGNLLLRCIGGGQQTVEVDIREEPVRAGDRFVLVTDGVWSPLSSDRLGQIAARGEPQATAEALVAAALEAGGPDNATAVVVDVRDPQARAVSRDVELPRDERPGSRDLWPRAVSLRAPLWPWVLLVASLAALAAAALQWSGIDAWNWLARLWRE
jgi:serine/threonine protein phosphatase PrpC